MRICIGFFAPLLSVSAFHVNFLSRGHRKTTGLSVATNKEELLFIDDTRSSVQDYYGKTLQESDDLKTNACCTAGAPPDYIRKALANLHPVTLKKYYGCGLTLPSYDLQGAKILDLGCGAGRDVYLAMQLVGPEGRVVGVDMTEEQLSAAREYQDYHSDKFGYDNVKFYKGFLEELDQIEGLDEEGPFDIIISNCVINLCADKEAVLKACRGLLKEGGEMYFSDVYANRRVPESLRKDKLLWGECLSGALYWNDFHNLAKKVGFFDPRLVEDSPITIQNKDVAALVERDGHGGLEFYSATYRLFAMSDTLLEPLCEDYGQAVIYKGTLDRSTSFWGLDKGHIFETGRVHPVCGNTYNMLYHNARLKKHFDFIGDFSRHYGVFQGCTPSGGIPFDEPSEPGGKSSCC